MRRTGYTLGWALLAACVIAYPFTVSTVWVLGYGAETRAAAVGLHSGRVAVVYHNPTFLDPGPFAGTERAEPSAQNFLLPYVTTGRRTMISIPLYIPMLVAASLMAWRFRKHSGPTRGFAMAPATSVAQGGGGPA